MAVKLEKRKTNNENITQILKKCSSCYKKDFDEQVEKLDYILNDIEYKFSMNSKVTPIMTNEMEQEINTISTIAFDLRNLFIDNNKTECQEDTLLDYEPIKKYFDECQEKYQLLSKFYKNEYKESRVVDDETINHYYVYFSHVTSQIKFYLYRIKELSLEINELMTRMSFIESINDTEIDINETKEAIDNTETQINATKKEINDAKEDIEKAKKKVDDSESRIITNSLIFMSLLATIITIISFVISAGNSLLNKDSDQWTIAITFTVPALVIIISIIVFFNLFYHLFYKEKCDNDEKENPSLELKKKGTLIVTYAIFGFFVVAVIVLLILGFIFNKK